MVREPLRHHADDRVRLPADADGLADQRPVRAEPAPPEPLGQQHHACTRGLFRRREEASVQRRHPEHRRQVPGDLCAPHGDRVARARQRHLGRARQRDRLELRRAGTPRLSDLRFRRQDEALPSCMRTSVTSRSAVSNGSGAICSR